MPETSAFRLPQFLGPQHEPAQRVRCAIHGFIRYSVAERRIIDHRIFRRLRYIRQLALTEFIYPGATHTRFEHSLGVMEMATRIFDRLAADSGAQMEEMFAGVESLREDTMARARQICRLAALLHDTGHCCFSHAAESVLHEGEDHESFTVRLLQKPTVDSPNSDAGAESDDSLWNLLEGQFFEGCADLTASMIKPGRESAPQLQLLRDIVSGQVDADRADYLLRDSHHCGVDYGRFDHRRLIECLTGWQNADTGELVVGIKRDGIHTVESLILARYQMSTQVYYHRLRRIYDYYLKQYFAALERAEFDTTHKLLEWNDIRAMNRLLEAAKAPEAPGHQWARRIIERDHHRDVFSLDERAGPQAAKSAATVLDRIREKYADVDFIADLPDKPITIHKIARDDDREPESSEFPVIEQGRKTSLGLRSQILNVLPNSFRVGFIFADVDDRTVRDEIRTRCRALWNELR